MTTPRELDDARAAIWLKTSVAEIAENAGLGPGPHAYVDSDVVAVADDVDRIFERFAPPVTFGSDLPFAAANLRTFSSHAVECECAVERERLARYFRRLDSLTAFHREHGELAALADPALYEGARFTGERRRGRWHDGIAEGGSAAGGIHFRQRFANGEPVEIVYSFVDAPWRLAKRGDASRLEDDAGWFRFDASPEEAGGGHWEDERGDSLRRFATPGGERREWFRDGRPRRTWRPDASSDAGGAWVDAAGVELGVCDHLADRLESLFGTPIPRPDWVPWNGGVFLFDASAAPFLADWRSRCLRLFAEPGFRVRDQGALVSAAWARGLAEHPRLPPADNRIVDRRSPANAGLRLAALRAEGARLLHLIGGGDDDMTWPLAKDLAAVRIAGDDGRA